MTLIKKKSFSHYIKSRIKRNKNFLGLFVGPTGSGKSYSSIRLAENLDPKFDIVRVVFSAKEFMKVINEGKIRKGQVIVWEEIGISMNARSWQSLTNKLINYVMQSFRHKNIIVLMNCPDPTFLDIATRKLLHCIFETESIDFKNKQVIVKPKLIQVNKVTGKVYMKYLRVITEEGVLPFNKLRLGLPNQRLRIQYENKREEFTKKLNINIHKQLKKMEEIEEEKLKPIKELTRRQMQILKYLKDGLLMPEIASKLKIHVSVVHFHVNQSKKKGYQIIPIKKESKLVYYEVVGLN